MNPENHPMMRLLRRLGENAKALEVRASLMKSGTFNDVALPASIWNAFHGIAGVFNQPKQGFFSQSQKNAVVEEAAHEVILSTSAEQSEAPATIAAPT